MMRRTSGPGGSPAPQTCRSRPRSSGWGPPPSRRVWRFPWPRHHALGRVHVADAGPRLGAGHRGPAGVGEQVQHPDGPPGVPDLLHGEIPVHRLFRKQARVLEVHGLHLEGQVPVADLPALRQGLLLPVAAAGLAAEIPGVGPLPGGVLPGAVPDGLGVRPHQVLLSPALQLLSPAAVQQLIVLPCSARSTYQNSSRQTLIHCKSCYYTALGPCPSTVWGGFIPPMRRKRDRRAAVSQGLCFNARHPTAPGQRPGCGPLSPRP